ncbi:DUF1716-domain-containing protein [Atractiella rhizophila]|nr:DUF1716-domain-containing protein [Atractiella rhizophila]
MVEEEEEDEEFPSGGDFAPGNDADYYAEEDEEGRFYGGGLNSTQKGILDIMDTAPNETAEPEQLNVVGVRRHLLNLEKAINENNNMRSKFPNDPPKFVDSEFALEQALRSLLLLTQSPTQYYPEMIRLKTVDSLTQLLTHENVDIACTVVDVLDELLDEDVGDEEEDEEEKKVEAFKALVNSLLDLSILDLLVDNLGRLNPEEETERKGIYQTLSFFESLLSVVPTISYKLLTHESFLSFTFKQLKKKKSTADENQNRFYVAELTAILLQSVGLEDEEKREKALQKWGEQGVDAVLTALSAYRKRDPVDGDETEYVENLFDCLCSALHPYPIKKAFMDAEGVELMVMMMMEKAMARTRAIKVLSHALSGPDGTELCHRFVNVRGLKTLFSAFMGKNSKKSESRGEDEEHILSILSSLLSNLESDSTPRIRLLAKFVEKDLEKVDQLLELRENWENLVTAKENEISSLKNSEDVELDEDEIYLRRLEGGLFSLQLINYIIAWIVMEDDGVREHVKMLLRRKGKDFKDVNKILEEYKNGMGEEAEDQKSIIDQLMAYLGSL